LPLLVDATIPPSPVHVPSRAPFWVSRRSGKETEEEVKVPLILELTVLSASVEADRIPVIGLAGVAG